MKVIVTTTINAPTKAIRKFDAMRDWTLLVVGDKRTPPDYKLDRGIYLSPEQQETLYPELSEAIGWNCIQRRNIGFIYAIKVMNADRVATVDDDNIPLEHWGEDFCTTRVAKKYLTDSPCFDPLQPHLNIWHRGFPIQLVSTLRWTANFTTVNCDIQANLWNGDPDVDAICRMLRPGSSSFDHVRGFYTSNKPMPFNSQNTMLHTKVLPHYFMFPGIGRMDDIWAAYYVQALGYQVVFGPPTVEQIRNEHDIITDMRNEYIGYENTLELVEALADSPEAIYDFLPWRSARAFRIYQKLYA